MQKVNINYFALFRDLVGINQEHLETNASTAEELYEELKEKYNFPLTKCRLKVAINDEFTDFSQKISNGDKIVFIPPVAGG